MTSTGNKVIDNDNYDMICCSLSKMKEMPHFSRKLVKINMQFFPFQIHDLPPWKTML